MMRSGYERVDRQPSVAGLGPHGEFPAPVEQLRVSDESAARARAAHYTVAVVVHTTQSDWSKQQLAGIAATLGRYNAAIIEILDCDFQADHQIAALEALTVRRPDAIIAIPVDDVRTAEAFARVAEQGIKLVLMDNAPVGLLAGKHYVSVVSADNFGNGQAAAETLAGYVPDGGVVGIVGFGVGFFATNEREIGFRKWINENRADIVLWRVAFVDAEEAGEVAVKFLHDCPEACALFVVWDEPAVLVASALRGIGRELPITTIDLGNEAAIEIAGGGLIKGVGAQLPYDQGVAEALATIMALGGDEPPPWVVVPALSVTWSNVLAAYQAVWHQPAPPELRRALESNRQVKARP
jgi:ribose transport system substrate-binding protein